MRDTSEIFDVFRGGKDPAAQPQRSIPARRLRALPRPTASRLPPTAPPRVPLIGRTRELAELGGALYAALDGETRMVLVGGEPGIGKTRLARAIADDAASHGVPVWWGRGWEDGTAPAFWPWNTALRGWLEQHGPDAALAAAGRWTAELAHVFPVLREHVPGLAPSECPESDGARFRLFELVSRFVTAVAHPTGLVVVLDDVQWADRDSLRLLEFVGSALTDARVLVVATIRDGEMEPDDHMAAAVARLTCEPSVRRLALDGLSREDCARWMVSGDPATLHRETNGNPFFLTEVAPLVTEADTGIDPRRIPPRVRGVIGRRLERLGADSRAALSVAALCGEVIEAAVVDGADHLARAVRARLLVEHDGQAGRWRFAHALVRRMLIAELEPSVRASWEARIASARLRTADASPAPGAGTFRCDGEIWTVSLAGRDVRLRDGKGPRYLAALLAAPGRELHVLELAAGAPLPGATAPAADGLRVGTAGRALEDAPDARARREYRTHVAELRAELEEAEQYSDTGRTERLRAELDFLSTQLAQRFGAHVRTRGPAETARKAVTKVLRIQIGKLLDVHPALGEHLREAIRMGTFCSYAPRTPIAWDLGSTRR